MVSENMHPFWEGLFLAYCLLTEQPATLFILGSRTLSKNLVGLFDSHVYIHNSFIYFLLFIKGTHLVYFTYAVLRT